MHPRFGSLAGADGWSITSVAAFPICCGRLPLSSDLLVFDGQNIRGPLRYPSLHSSQFSTRIVDKVVKGHLDTPPRTALTCLHQQLGDKFFGKIAMQCQ